MGLTLKDEQADGNLQYNATQVFRSLFLLSFVGSSCACLVEAHLILQLERYSLRL